MRTSLPRPMPTDAPQQTDPSRAAAPARQLVLVLGDQLDIDGAAFDGFDARRDAVLMIEAEEEAAYVPQHQKRLVLFFSAMRHFRDQLVRRRRRVHYVELDAHDNRGTLAGELARWIESTKPSRVVLSEPGDQRVLHAIEATAKRLATPLEVRTDRHFIDSRGAFAAYAAGRASLLLESYYRHLRRREEILVEGNEPVGGRWNFDADNRERFGRKGPGRVPAPKGFTPDRITREVMAMVVRRFPTHPGKAEGFDYPVTGADASAALEDFVTHRLEQFGRFQDAMATGQPYLYHSRLASALNLHLLDPRTAIDAALAALATGRAPLNAVEGFVRQILGWREFVRGVYWWKMPRYAGLNALDAQLPMPAFMWTGETDMNCVRESVAQLIEHAYAHHIQRLMVLGQLALLLGVRPYEVHRWHMALYIDAIDWVSAPNVLGMSQYADGGIVGTKPYCASGNYISRMSDYCRNCRYDPRKSESEDACPFTTLYWDFLLRHRQRFAANRRMTLQMKNLDRKSPAEHRAIRRRAGQLKRDFTASTYGG